MPYSPKAPLDITSVDTLRAWVTRELEAISKEFNETAALDLRPVYAAPLRPREGMIVYADGTSWDPGYGAGLYVYRSGGWVPASIPYVDGDWTPTVTFATPGDLAVTYAVRIGHYTRIGNLVIAHFTVTTSAFTFTTAAGALAFTGLPFTAKSDINWRGGTAIWSGITKAGGYTDFAPYAALNTTSINFNLSGSGVAGVNVAAADTPTGGTLSIGGSVIYRKA